MDSDKETVLRDMLEERIPFNKVLGLRLVTFDEGNACLRMDHRSELVGNYVTKVLHGGVISALLDVAGGAAIMATHLEDSLLYGLATVDLRVDFLRPGAGHHFLAKGEVMRSGRVLTTTRMELLNDTGVLIAIGTAVYRISQRHTDHAVSL